MTEASSIRTQALMTGLYWLYDRIAGRKAGHAVVAAGPVPEAGIDRMIRRAAAQAGTVGFATNMGGLLTLPLALPANLAGVGSLQINLIQDIARARGYDLQSDQVRTLTVACLAGSAALDILKDVGVGVGTRLTQRALMGLGGTALGRINRAVGSRLAMAVGSSGALTVARVIPFVGGAISGTMDGLATAAVGAAAKRVFVRRTEAEAEAEPGVAPSAKPGVELDGRASPLPLAGPAAP